MSLVGVMLTFAIVMAIALLVNAMSANVAERAVELGTLNAAGMPRGILGRLVAAENLLLTVIGTLVGLVSGTMLARWFMSNYENLSDIAGNSGCRHPRSSSLFLHSPQHRSFRNCP